MWLHCIKNEPIFWKTVWTIWQRCNVKVDFSNYATKTDFKNVTHVFALKTNLASLKTEIDKLDIDTLAPSVDLSKLSDVVKYDVVKKTVYDKLVAK